MSQNQSTHLSASQINRYSMCSLQWYFSRRYMPAFTSACLVFGKAFHKGVETFYQARLEGRDIGLGAMLEAYQTCLNQEQGEIRYNKNDTRESMLQKAEDMFKAFLCTVKPGKVIGVEEEIYCELDPELPPFKGFIDLMELREIDGQECLCLVDFKTAASVPKVEDVSPDQLLIYVKAAENMGILNSLSPNTPVRAIYTYITKTKSPQVVEIEIEATDAAALRTLAKIKQCHKGMAHEVIYPCTGWQCSGCGYQERCKAWPEETTS